MKWTNILPASIRAKRDKNLFSLLKNSSWLAVSGIGGSGFRFIQTIIVARILGVENFGLLAIIITYVSILNQLVDFRIYETVIKYVSEFINSGEKGKAQATIKLCYFLDAATGIAAFALVIITASFAANYLLHQTETGWWFRLYALSLIFSTTNGTSSAILQIYNKFSWISIQGLIQAGIGLVIVIIVLYINPTIKGIIWAYVFTELFGGISINLLALKVLRREGFHDWKTAKISLLKGKFKEMRRFLITTNVHVFLGLITKNMDIMFLGYFRNPTEVGFYKIAKSMAELMAYIYDPIRGAIYPELAKIWSGKRLEEFSRLIRHSTMFLATILFPAALFLMVFMPWIISFTIGSAFSPATNATRILLIGIIVSGIFVWLRPAFLSMGRPGIPMYAGIAVAFCQIVLSILLVPILGYIGSAIIQSFLSLFGHALLLPIFVWLLIKSRNIYPNLAEPEPKRREIPS